MRIWKTQIKWIILILAAVMLSACSLPGLGAGFNDGIIIVAMSTTEAQIGAYIVEGMVKYYMDIDSQIVNNLGSSTMAHQALMNRDANITGIQYTGTSLTGPLGLEPITDPDQAFNVVVNQFAERFDQKWFPSYGFDNTYAFLVTQEMAAKYDLETVSDLKPIAGELTAGVDSSWIQRKGDGYAAFLDTYQFDYQRVVPMQIGLVYDALQAGAMDVVLGYSTDGRIASYNLKVLEDDLHLFPPYDASPVARYDVLEAYPDLENILLKLEGVISTGKMQELNYMADNNLIEPKVVAIQFLEENKYFEDKQPYIEPLAGRGKRR